MRPLAFFAVLLFPLFAFAQAAEAALDNPLAFLKIVFAAIKDGNWALAASALLVIVVALLRMYGKKLSDKMADKGFGAVLAFIFETKPGGWLLGMLTAVAGGVGTAMLAGEQPTWVLVKPILMVFVGGAALWELLKDLKEWWDARKTSEAPPAQ